jgi:hypothetical protein
VADTLNYARPARPRALPASAPRRVAMVVAALAGLCWLVFFTVSSMVLVDTHFTNRPQTIPAFRLTPWRSVGPLQTRDALLPLTFHTLRYTQVTADGGATVETTGYHADVRWGPTGVALLATAALPAIAYFGLRRFSRRPGRLPRTPKTASA